MRKQRFAIPNELLANQRFDSAPIQHAASCLRVAQLELLSDVPALLDDLEVLAGKFDQQEPYTYRDVIASVDSQGTNNKAKQAFLLELPDRIPRNEPWLQRQTFLILSKLVRETGSGLAKPEAAKALGLPVTSREIHPQDTE